MSVDSIGRATASEFIKRIDAAMKSLADAGEALRPILSKDQFRIFADAFGSAIGQLDLGVLEIIYRCHPDLRLRDMPRAPTFKEIDEGTCSVGRSAHPKNRSSQPGSESMQLSVRPKTRKRLRATKS